VAAARKYPEEVRERALLRTVVESRRPIAHVARSLGVHPGALRRWVREAAAERTRRREPLPGNEREELRRLRREIAALRRANDRLKAASVLFAGELD